MYVLIEIKESPNSSDCGCDGRLNFTTKVCSRDIESVLNYVSRNYHCTTKDILNISHVGCEIYTTTKEHQSDIEIRIDLIGELR